MNPREGELLARRYELQERIATGGMSVVWRAFDRSLHRTVAIKLLAGPFSCDREIIRREARAAARLVHPDVIEVYDYGETVTPSGRLAAYVVMRLLDGPSLADRIASGPLPWPEAVTVAGRLAGVLSAAHAQGIVHCDVTPANVLLTSDGAKLLDFGIAAPAGSSYEELSGTPPYVAPERLAGAPADPAVDVYALGVVLFEMLTGRLPYPETTWEDVAAARHHGPAPVPEGAPEVVARLCRACLSPDPARRPTSREAAAVLRSACAREGTHPAPSSVAGAPKGARRVHGWSGRATMTAGALLLSGAALTVATGYGLSDVTPWMALPLPISTATAEPALPASPKGSPPATPANASSATPSPPREAASRAAPCPIRSARRTRRSSPLRPALAPMAGRVNPPIPWDERPRRPLVPRSRRPWPSSTTRWTGGWQARRSGTTWRSTSARSWPIWPVPAQATWSRCASSCTTAGAKGCWPPTCSGFSTATSAPSRTPSAPASPVAPRGGRASRWVWGLSSGSR
ncbi:protein kinase domain-containing protein [Nonomuraea dietziae]|uniref:protein kinase domain-containing protein n=1 Tax=Nonomuraea dietziae TaxID=65515 RepID=UPI0033C281BE